MRGTLRRPPLLQRGVEADGAVAEVEGGGAGRRQEGGGRGWSDGVMGLPAALLRCSRWDGGETRHSKKLLELI